MASDHEWLDCFHPTTQQGGDGCHFFMRCHGVWPIRCELPERDHTESDDEKIARLTAELAAAQTREQACMERIKDALDCLPRALDGSRPFSLDQRAEVMLAIEALRAALAAAGVEGQG